MRGTVPALSISGAVGGCPYIERKEKKDEKGNHYEDHMSGRAVMPQCPGRVRGRKTDGREKKRL